MFESYLKPPISFPSVSGSVCTFNSQYAGLPLKSHTVALTATQSGSGTPSPSNPLPISGADSIHIQNTCGINQWDEQWEAGGLAWATGQPAAGTNRYRSKNYCLIEPSTQYYVNGSVSVFFYKADFSFISYQSNYNTVITTPSTARFFKILNTNTATYGNDVSINYPSTDTAYHAFVGQSATVQIGSTVYGGEYDARTGVFIVTDKIIDLGNLSWSASGSNFVSPYFALTDTNIIPPATNNDTLNGMCEVLNLTSYNSLADKCIALSSDKNVFAINSDYTNANDFKNSVTGYYLKYPLATPTTIQLPPCPIDTLNGVNNIWADTGDTTLQYIKLG